MSLMTDSPTDRSLLKQATQKVTPFWGKKWVFLSQALSNFDTVGAVAPSSTFLAKAIIHPLQYRPERPISVLEVGAGTGVFTLQILKMLGQGDRLDVYEMNTRFFGYLTQCVEKNNHQARGIQCKLHNDDVRQLNGKRAYDFIVCGVPFNSFDVETVDQILDILMNHLTASGVFTYFEYSLHPLVRSCFLKATDRDRLQKVSLRINSFTKKYQFGCRQVWLNLPPAKAHYCRKEPASYTSLERCGGRVTKTRTITTLSDN